VWAILRQKKPYASTLKFHTSTEFRRYVQNITNFMKLSPSRETARCVITQEHATLRYSFINLVSPNLTYHTHTQHTPEGLHYGDIWTNIGRATLGRNFVVTSGKTAYEACSVTCNSVYRLSICSRTEENHEKPWSSWPVAGPSGCKLTYSQQSGIKYVNPNVCPYLRCCFIWKNRTERTVWI
jgi:hypothetical protein